MEQSAEKIRGRRRELVGVVTSDKMDKTIVVQISTRKLHSLYKKYVTHSKKYKAHDETNSAHIGDKVRIVETRPLSKDKRWRLIEVVERAQ